MIDYKIIATNAFKKELKLIKKRNKDLMKLRELIINLCTSNQLNSKYKDHLLINTNINNCRECHIEPDWLLIYAKNDKNKIIYLIETGSHSDLFK